MLVGPHLRVEAVVQAHWVCVESIGGQNRDAEGSDVGLVRKLVGKQGVCKGTRVHLIGDVIGADVCEESCPVVVEVCTREDQQGSARNRSGSVWVHNLLIEGVGGDD